MPPRKSYTAAFKLEVIDHAKEYGNREAGRHYGINEKQVRDLKKTDQLRITKKSKKNNRWLKEEDLAEKLETWVLEQRQPGLRRSEHNSNLIESAKHRKKLNTLKLSDNLVCIFKKLPQFIRSNLYMFFAQKLQKKAVCNLYKGATYSLKNTVVTVLVFSL